MDGLFADLVEAGIFRQIRDVTMHLAVHLDVLHYFGPIRLEATVHIVQADTRHFAGRPIVQLGGKVLGEGVVLAVLFPTGNKVVAIFPDHTHHFGDFLGRILEIGVHGDHDVASGRGKTLIQGGRFAIIPAETDGAHRTSELIGQLLDHGPGVVRGTVIYEDDLTGIAPEGTVDPSLELRQGLGFVVQGNND